MEINAEFNLTQDVANCAGNKTIFFVCGSMKSGTTWVQMLLDAHPAISCGGEGHFADQMAQKIQQSINEYNEYITWKNSQEIGNLPGYQTFNAEDTIDLIRYAMNIQISKYISSENITAVGEKTPDNIYNIPFLHTVFPQAKFIHIVRDGRDCAVSGWFHNKRLAPEWLRENHPSIHEYSKCTALEWSRDQRIAFEFSKQAPGQIISIRYEDMIADCADVLGRLLAFVGVESDPHVVNDCCASAGFTARSGGRTPGQEDQTSFFRKGISGDWRNHLDQEDNKKFVDIAQEWLSIFGYPLE